MSGLTYPIRLDQFLKLANLVGSGGEAKMLIERLHAIVSATVAATSKYSHWCQT